MADKLNIRFRLNPSSGVAPYRQLVQQVKEAVFAGHLKPGDRLPPVRQVIKGITINPNTVHRAYRELEYLGIIETQWGVGTFIRSPCVEYGVPNCPPGMAELLSIWIENAKSNGTTDKEILEMVLSRLRRTIRVDS